MEATWKSPRALEAEERASRIAAFDRLIDMALDNTIEMDEAIEAFKFAGALYVPDTVVQ